MFVDKENFVFLDGCFVKVEFLGRGKRLYDDVKKYGYYMDMYVLNILVSLYGKCGSIMDVWDVFNLLL